jgi:hypothetical protein
LLWFCALVAAVIAYSAVWYPWTGSVSITTVHSSADWAADDRPSAVSGRRRHRCARAGDGWVEKRPAALELPGSDFPSGSAEPWLRLRWSLRLPLFKGLQGGSRQRRPNIILIGSIHCASISFSGLAVAGSLRTGQVPRQSRRRADATTRSPGRTRHGFRFLTGREPAGHRCTLQSGRANDREGEPHPR